MNAEGVLQIALTVGKGGLETMVANLAIGLQGSGWPTSVLLLDATGVNEGRLHEAGVECHVVGGRSLYSIPFHRRLRSLLRRFRPAVIHTHHFTPLLHTVVAAAGTGLEARWIHTEHAHEYLLGRPDYRMALRGLAKRVNRLVVVGRHQVDYYVNEVGIDGSRVVAVENGVDTTRFRPRNGTRPLGGTRFPGFVAVTAARLSPEKDQRTMVEAIGLCNEMMPSQEIHLVLIGDGAERDALERRVQELGIGGRVHFLGWREDLPGLLPAADVFLLSSISEGLPLAVLEGMACGLPVLTTPVGDLPRVVRAGETGEFFPTGDAAELASRLLLLAKEPARAREMGASARRFVEGAYSEEAMVARYAGLYGA